MGPKSLCCGRVVPGTCRVSGCTTIRVSAASKTATMKVSKRTTRPGKQSGVGDRAAGREGGGERPGSAGHVPGVGVHDDWSVGGVEDGYLEDEKENEEAGQPERRLRAGGGARGPVGAAGAPGEQGQRAGEGQREHGEGVGKAAD